MRKSNSITIKNATIDMENMTITEVNKDDQYMFDIKDVLGDFDGVEGVSLTIKKDSLVTD